MFKTVNISTLVPSYNHFSITKEAVLWFNKDFIPTNKKEKILNVF